MAVSEVMGPVYPYLPYCGTPPDPSVLWSRWNIDPILLVVLAAAVVAYASAAEPGAWPRVDPPLWRRACFYSGWAVGAVALVSPLCALSVSLFSARVGQHMVIEMVAAPLIALGLPLGRRLRYLGLLAPTTLFTATLWFWHAPGPYAATFQSDLCYWLMHLTAFAAALWLWSALFDAAGSRVGAFLAAAMGTTLQMGFLGALLTFATRPLFAVHEFTTAAWGLTQLEDQQLGGVIMWVPAGGVLVGAIVAAVSIALRRSETGAAAAAA